MACYTSRIETKVGCSMLSSIAYLKFEIPLQIVNFRARWGKYVSETSTNWDIYSSVPTSHRKCPPCKFLRWWSYFYLQKRRNSAVTPVSCRLSTNEVNAGLTFLSAPSKEDNASTECPKTPSVRTMLKSQRWFYAQRFSHLQQNSHAALESQWNSRLTTGAKFHSVKNFWESKLISTSFAATVILHLWNQLLLASGHLSLQI